MTKKLYFEGALRRCLTLKKFGWLGRIESVEINSIFVYNNNCLNKTIGIMVVILLVDGYGFKNDRLPYDSNFTAEV